ncbi:MAG: 23S rRNA (uracil(1939)-C(5))-methyltransferase RlmD [Anaerolineaceae bacterium]|nr:23S rRNA (uracil(1939)-C(5))-methyltransferase RlmD [Anaerolineaceae bacterium]
MEELFTLKIQSLVYEGYGLSRLPDGRAVFVPFVLPGETIQARIIEEKKGHAFAELVTVVDRHAQRITPRCGHFGVCGGCHYQHIPYRLQLEYKRAIFIEQLQRIAHLDMPKITKVIPSTEEWGYRNTLQFSLSAGGKLCFADFYNNQPFEVRECQLPMPEIGAFWPQIEFERGTQLERVEVRQNNDGDLMLVLRGSEKELPEMETEALASIVHLSGADQVVMAGYDHLVMRMLGKDFRLSASAFFQTNLAAAKVLVKAVGEAVVNSGFRSIMDVFCGVGLFSAFLAENADQIIGIESSPSACDDFAVNLDAYNNVSLYQGKAEQIIPSIKEKPDCMIVDPPRSGLKREATQAIIEKSPRMLIYVSCNPSTLAREAKYLIEAGYQLESSTLVDMFPQTFHIESVNIFSKNE